MMFGIDEDVAKLFVKNRGRFPSDKDVTRAAGINTLLPGSQIQEFCFEPCGYSMNGLLFDAYWTIHITPESHCSYASFETNVRMKNFTPLVKSVLAIFRPRKFTMTLFADSAGVAALKESPFAQVLTIPVVDSTAQAVLGPCVLVAEPTAPGGDYVSYPPSASPVAAAAAGAAGDAAAGAPLGSPTSSTASAASPTAGFVPGGVGFTAAAAAASSSSQLSTQLRRQATTTKLLGGVPGSSPGLNAYVMSNKCHTEFVGEYHSILGNFRLVGDAAHSSGGGGESARGVASSSSPAAASVAPSSAAPTPRPAPFEATAELPAAASATLALPRVKYVVERELAHAKGPSKLRTESM